MVSRCAGPGAASLRIHRAEARGLELAYFHEGVGGLPLVLLHGWPETKRIWWRNVAPLAAAGFEVIAPDLRGFGDSAPARDDAYDTVTHAGDVEALVRGALGHRRCVVCAGDLGGVIAQDLSLRFAGFVEPDPVQHDRPDAPQLCDAHHPRGADGRRLLQAPVP